MAQIKIPHTIYKYSELATFLDTAGIYVGYFGIVLSIISITSGDYKFLGLFLLGIICGIALKFAVAPKIAEKAFEKYQKRAVELDKISHCPKCGKLFEQKEIERFS